MQRGDYSIAVLLSSRSRASEGAGARGTGPDSRMQRQSPRARASRGPCRRFFVLKRHENIENSEWANGRIGCRVRITHHFWTLFGMWNMIWILIVKKIYLVEKLKNIISMTLHAHTVKSTEIPENGLPERHRCMTDDSILQYPGDRPHSQRIRYR